MLRCASARIHARPVLALRARPRAIALCGAALRKILKWRRDCATQLAAHDELEIVREESRRRKIDRSEVQKQLAPRRKQLRPAEARRAPCARLIPRRAGNPDH